MQKYKNKYIIISECVRKEELLIKLDNLLLNNEQNFKSFVSKFMQKLEARLNMEQYTIDRFEGKWAVCENIENGKMIEIERTKLPIDAKEGSIIRFENGEYKLDIDEENDISNRIKEKMNKLWKN